jgi:hypothetical protein
MSLKILLSLCSALSLTALAQRHAGSAAEGGLSTVLTRSELRDALKASCAERLGSVEEFDALMNRYGWMRTDSEDIDPVDSGYFQFDGAQNLRVASVYENATNYEYCFRLPEGEVRDVERDCIRVLHADDYVDRVDMGGASGAAAHRRKFNKWYLGDARSVRAAQPQLVCARSAEAPMVNRAGVDNAGIEEMSNFAMDSSLNAAMMELYESELNREGSRIRALSAADRRALKILVSDQAATMDEENFIAIDSTAKDWNPRLVSAAFGDLVQKAASVAPNGLDGIGYYTSLPTASDQEIWRERQSALNVFMAQHNGAREAGHADDRRYVMLSHKPRALLSTSEQEFLVRYISQISVGDRIARWNAVLGADRIVFQDFQRSADGRSLLVDTEAGIWDYYTRDWQAR